MAVDRTARSAQRTENGKVNESIQVYLPSFPTEPELKKKVYLNMVKAVTGLVEDRWAQLFPMTDVDVRATDRDYLAARFKWARSRTANGTKLLLEQGRAGSYLLKPSKSTTEAATIMLKQDDGKLSFYPIECMQSQWYTLDACGGHYVPKFDTVQDLIAHYSHPGGYHVGDERVWLLNPLY